MPSWSSLPEVKEGKGFRQWIRNVQQKGSQVSPGFRPYWGAADGAGGKKKRNVRRRKKGEGGEGKHDFPSYSADLGRRGGEKGRKKDSGQEKRRKKGGDKSAVACENIVLRFVFCLVS